MRGRSILADSFSQVGRCPGLNAVAEYMIFVLLVLLVERIGAPCKAVRVRDIVICGPSGTGKTFLLDALGQAAVDAGRHVA